MLRDELSLSLQQAGWLSSMLTTLAVMAALGFGLMAGRVGALRIVPGCWRWPLACGRCSTLH